MSNDVSVKIASDNSALNTGLKEAADAVHSFKEKASEQVAELGGDLTKAFALTAVLEGLKGVAEEFSQLADQSQKLGVSAESLQRMAVVAKASGVSVEELTKTIQKATKNAFEAAGGNEELSGAFQALGINAGEFVNLKPEEQLAALSEGYIKSGQNAQSLDAILKALGKSGADLIPILRKGPEALKEEMESAKVASNETVSELKEASETMEHVWQAVKVAGAEALNFLITRTQALGTGLAAIVAYVTALPHGFQAAAEAYDNTIQAAADLQLEKEEKEKAREKANKPVDTDALERAKELAEQQKKDAEELAKLKEQNAKKEEEAHYRNLELLQKQKELQENIAKLQGGHSASPLDSERNKGKILDYQKELEGVNKDIARDAEKADKERAEKDKRAKEEALKDNLRKEKEALREAENHVRSLESLRKDGPSVDNLRKIGGGVAGVNYNFNAGKDAIEKQQLDYSRQQVEKLSAIVKALEAKTNKLPVYDGSFS